jgi:hypothetical protein
MKPRQIRRVEVSDEIGAEQSASILYASWLMLREIAAQLAELNRSLKPPRRTPARPRP